MRVLGLRSFLFRSLCERRGLSSCLPTAFPLDGSKNLHTALRKILPARLPSSNDKQFDDELCSPTTISPLQVGPPTRCDLAPGVARTLTGTHPSSSLSSIEKRYVLTPFICAVYIKKTDLRPQARFRVSTFVEALPALLISALLFFSRLVVYAFRANNILAYITIAIVAFCSLCLALSLAPLVYHDCPYQTPLFPCSGSLRSIAVSACYQCNKPEQK